MLPVLLFHQHQPADSGTGISAVDRTSGIAIAEASNIMPHQPADWGSDTASSDRTTSIAIADASSIIPPHQPAEWIGYLRYRRW